MFDYQKIRKVGGFTLVELLVSVSILATISIVGYVSMHSYTMKVNNSRRIASMDTLKSSLNNYYQVKKTLPEPTTNRIYYDEKGTYVHSSTGSYGVSGHASRHWYSEDWANNFAFDPDTKQFFGYGKLSDNSAFDIATALYVDTGIYKAYVDGTYDGGRFPSLVRAYHSSDFVIQDSTEFLPYNPFERKVTAKLVTWSGTTTGSDPSIWIGSIDETNPSQPTCNPSPTLSLTGELMTGDCIGVGTGSTALLHISDGSELSLGSTGSTTILELKDLRYKDSEDPITSVLIKLISGEVWAEAPRLRKINENESEMQIYTTTALAAVRGTVFGVSIDPTSKNTNLSLAVGEIKVGRNPVVSDGIPLFGNVSVTTDTFGTTDGFSTTATGGFVLSGSTSSMIVPDGGKAISLTVPPVITGHELDTPTSATPGTIDSIELQKKLNFIPFGLGYRPVVTDVSFTGAIGSTQTGVLSVTFDNPGADSYRVSFGTGAGDYSTSFVDTNPFVTGSLNTGTPTMTVTGVFTLSSEKRSVAVRLCYQGTCSSPYIARIYGGSFSLHGLNNQKPERLTCPDGQRQFGGFGCQPKELVAFAPYDRPSDIVMYTSRGGSLGFSTNRVIGSGSYAYHDDARYALEAIRGFTELKNSCVPIYNSTTTAFVSNLCSTNPTIDLANLASKGFRFDVPNSFFDIPQVGSPAVRGVLVENNGNTDYLKYDLSALELKDKFAIEVSVRGAALKRPFCGTYCRYHLFEFKDINNKGIYVTLYNGSLALGSHTWLGYTGFSNVLKIDNFSNLSDNTFYKVIATFKNNTWGLSIKGDGLEILGTPTGVIPFIVSIDNTEGMYTGGRQYNTSYDSQWNDIIDYTKIYKLK